MKCKTSLLVCFFIVFLNLKTRAQENSLFFNVEVISCWLNGESDTTNILSFSKNYFETYENELSGKWPFSPSKRKLSAIRDLNSSLSEYLKLNDTMFSTPNKLLLDTSRVDMSISKALNTFLMKSDSLDSAFKVDLKKQSNIFDKKLPGDQDFKKIESYKITIDTMKISLEVEKTKLLMEFEENQFKAFSEVISVINESINTGLKAFDERVKAATEESRYIYLIEAKNKLGISISNLKTAFRSKYRKFLHKR